MKSRERDWVTCPDCEGTGQVNGKYCPVCGGDGIVREGEAAWLSLVSSIGGRC